MLNLVAALIARGHWDAVPETVTRLCGGAHRAWAPGRGFVLQHFNYRG